MLRAQVVCEAELNSGAGEGSEESRRSCRVDWRKSAKPAASPSEVPLPVYSRRATNLASLEGSRTLLLARLLGRLALLHVGKTKSAPAVPPHRGRIPRTKTNLEERLRDKGGRAIRGEHIEGRWRARGGKVETAVGEREKRTNRQHSHVPAVTVDCSPDPSSLCHPSYSRALASPSRRRAQEFADLCVRARLPRFDPP